MLLLRSKHNTPRQMKTRKLLILLLLMTITSLQLLQPAFAGFECCWSAPRTTTTDNCDSFGGACTGVDPCVETQTTFPSYCYGCPNPFATCPPTIALGSTRTRSGICFQGSTSQDNPGRGCMCVSAAGVGYSPWATIFVTAC